MGCLVSDYFPQPATVQWNSGAITSGIRDFPAVLQTSSGRYISSSQLTVPVSSWKSGSFQCHVSHAATSSEVTKRIEVCSAKPQPEEPEVTTPVVPEVRLLHSSCNRRTDEATIQLVCFITSFYPKEITVDWLVGGKTGVPAANTETPRKDAKGHTFSTTSTVNITQVAWKEGKAYTCQVTHRGVVVKRHASHCPGESGDCATTGVKISIVPPTPADLYMNGEPKLICLVSGLDSAEGVKITWSWEQTGPLNPDPQQVREEPDDTVTVESALTISKAKWLAGNVFTCKAEHSSFASPLTKTIEKETGMRSRPHVYLFRPHNEELKSRHPNVSITCLVKDFKPEDISIRWLENHNVMTGHNFVTTPVQVDINQDSYFVYSKLTVPKADWNEGYSYTCHVVHEGLEMKYTQRTIEKVQGKK
uniref:Uncharacterized protein n=1 Tax=Sphaerodactylus townsendi TaxID=933632 RepID=A0ACB8EWT6_9SAUR